MNNVPPHLFYGLLTFSCLLARAVLDGMGGVYLLGLPIAWVLSMEVLSHFAFKKYFGSICITSLSVSRLMIYICRLGQNLYIPKLQSFA